MTILVNTNKPTYHSGTRRRKLSWQQGMRVHTLSARDLFTPSIDTKLRGGLASMSVPWNRTATDVNESKTRQSARLLGGMGQAITPVKPWTCLLGLALPLNWFLKLGCTGLIGCAALIGSACATKPFNVKPRLVAPPAGFTGRATAGSVEIKAAIIRDEDYLHTTFDANLILAGILPVNLAVQNSGSGPIDIKGMRFLLSAGGKQQKPMEARRAFKRLMGYYKIRAYSVDGYKASLADFVSYGFDQRA